MKKIILIVGPTGVGKTEVGLYLAKKFDGEIINADSRQVYGDLRIGTSLPPAEFFNNVPHHLFGVCQLDESWDASRFQREVDRVIGDIMGKKRIPFVVGGTGLYVKTLLFGLFDGPGAQKDIRRGFQERIEKEGLQKLYDELRRVDPESAARIHPNDPVRIIRALEVFRLTGNTISSQQERHRFAKARYDYLKIGLTVERQLLASRINERVDRMIHQGLEEEVRGLIKKGAGDLSRSIGYKEWYPFFEGKVSREAVVDNIKSHTRQFAKRQMTWFRKEKDIVWKSPEELREIEGEVGKFLSERSKGLRV